MADLSGQQLKDSYQNLLTIDATIESNPLSGQLENGLGNAITALGIGTDSPDAPIHISQSAPKIRLNDSDLGSGVYSELNGSDGNIYIQADKGNGQASSLIRFDVDGDAKATIKSSGDFAIQDSSNNEAFYWDASTARLGIGSTSPSSCLTVKSDEGALFADASGTRFIDIIPPKTANSFVGEIGTRSSHNLVFNTVDTPRMTIDTSGHVTVQDGGFLIIDTGAVGANPRLYFRQDDINATNFIEVDRGTNAMEFWNNGSERMRILSGGGITFNGDTATANALDDYEEGTWTPAWDFATSGSAVINVSSATYTKIGRMVSINARIFTASISSPTGNATLTGLPFTANSSIQSVPVSIGQVYRWGNN